MRTTTYISAIFALSGLSVALPTSHNQGLAKFYLPTFGSNIVANDTAEAAPAPVKSTTDTNNGETECKPFIMPRAPAECVQKSGELVCHGYSLYCRFPTDWGVGYDPLGECWTCK
ncbi:hypothetical protein F4820DRAFT_430671 [Hypoxylon rubiginosum]|uniref:Uncharacterized protein n=1 Tax=Hypoxylon rubiginosum TaxID=110542 RepID=A0ACB9YTQ0_9PEZI|nr:hypothetical protein F4820DRAFT_430671 [Hypoxylon rubiginosum]